MYNEPTDIYEEDDYYRDAMEWDEHQKSDNQERANDMNETLRQLRGLS